MRRAAFRIIGAMPAWLKIPPMPPLPLTARAPLFVLSATMLLWGGVPTAVFPFTAMDASHYRAAIDSPAARCAKDAVPTPGDCWSSRTARVTITGVDHLESGDIAYAVLEVPGRDQVRSDFTTGLHVDLLSVGASVTVRYWHSDIVLVYPAVAGGAAPVVLTTRDNPSYRAAHFPTTDAVTALLALIASVLFGRTLLGDLRAWRRRRAGVVDARELASLPGFGRGLARYGFTVPSAPPEANLTGTAQPLSVLPRETADTAPTSEPEPQPPGTRPGGNGWNIRTG
jgi:hypothetical protein